MSGLMVDFTKYLYAADAPGDGSCGRALILPQFVAISLNDLQGWGVREAGPWGPTPTSAGSIRPTS